MSELLHKLAVIALIEKEYKLNVYTLSFTQNSSWCGSLNRYLRGESRRSLIDMLNKLIQQTIQAIQDYSNTEFCKLVINHLNSAKTGIENLSVTYKDDPNIVAQLEIILENITIQLDKNKSLIIPGYKVPVYTEPKTPITVAKEEESFVKETLLNLRQKYIDDLALGSNSSQN